MQTVLEEVLQVLVRILVPVTPHLAEDIWKHIPETIKNASSKEESVVLTSFPSNTARFKNDKLDALWSDVIPVRNTVNKALEQARGSKKIGAPLEAQVVLSFDDDALATKVESLGADLAALFITSQAKVHRDSQSSDDHASSGRNGG